MRRGTDIWRGFLAAALSVLILGACGPVPQPFRQDTETKARTTLARATITSGVRILPVGGLSAEHGTALSELLADRLRDLGTVASASDALHNTHFLSPNLVNGADGVLIRWDLFDPDGVQRDTIVTQAPPLAELDALLQGRNKPLREMVASVAGKMHTTLNPRASNPVVDRSAALAKA